MKNKQALSDILYAILFVAIFILLQTGVHIGCAGIYSLISHKSFATIMKDISTGQDTMLLSVIIALNSMVTIILFLKKRWAKVSNTYIKSHPWGVLTWSALLAIGSILPFQYIYECINITMPEHSKALFENIMKEPLGYMFIGIFAPITEEIVFRGAVLKSLLKAFNGKKQWIAITLSAILFGFIHLNLAQGVHAFLIGLILGWMYSRTNSIVPGIVLHWINNTVAYLMFYVMPQMSDGKLIDFFHGDDKLMYGGLFFSLCIFVPSLYQLTLRLKKVQ